MKPIFLFLAPGFEETEAIATADILKRAKLNVQFVSIDETPAVTGSHGITVLADSLFEETDFSDGEMLILPGGMPGTKNLEMHAGLKKLIADYHAQGKHISAICAAPKILGNMGILKGEKATVYPGNESCLLGAEVADEERVVVSGQFITAKGPGVSALFGLKIVEILKGKTLSGKIAEAFIL